MENFDFSRLENQINEVQNSQEADKQERVAKLIVLLNSVEKELTTVYRTLGKLRDYHERINSKHVVAQCIERMNRVEQLKTKINKAKLELTYTFL